MRQSRPRGYVSALVCGAGICWTAGLGAQGPAPYPQRNVQIVVPYTPGTGADIVARALAPKLAERWKVGVITDNRPGATGNIGTDFVAKAAPDGHVLLMTATSFGTAPALSAEASVRSGEELRAGRAGRGEHDDAGRASAASGEVDARIHPAREAPAGAAALFVSRQRRPAAPDDRADQARDRHRYRSRAVQGLGRRGHRSRRRARPGDGCRRCRRFRRRCAAGSCACSR